MKKHNEASKQNGSCSKRCADLIRLIMESGYLVVGRVPGEDEPRVLNPNEVDYPQDVIRLQKPILGYNCLSAELSLEDEHAVRVTTELFKFFKNCSTRRAELSLELTTKAKQLNSECWKFGCSVELDDDGWNYIRSNELLNSGNAYSSKHHAHHDVYHFMSDQLPVLEAFIASDRMICSSKK